MEFHPAWHELMRVAVASGLHAAPWRDDRPGAHVARAAAFYVWGQTEAGHGCPISMTYSIVPALRHAPDLARRFEPLLAAPDYDPGLRPPEEQARPAVGHVDDREAGRLRRPRQHHHRRPGRRRQLPLTGHKWFTSAPMNDLFMVLAQVPGASPPAPGLSCFLLPRVLPDGTRNGMRLMRLKDKLGNRSNASAEVEYEDATAWLVGEAGRGVRTILDMVNSTRLDCVLAAATGMRVGVAPGDASRRPPPGVRQDADRPAADGERAGRPGDRVGGRHRRRPPAGRRHRPGRPRRPSRRPRSAGWPSR